MSNDKGIGKNSTSDDDSDALAVLIRAAGRREAPPHEHYDSVFAAASDALEEKLRQRRNKIRFAWAAGLAAVALLTSLVTRFEVTVGDSVQVAATDRVLGTVRMMGAADDRWREMQANGSVLNNGTRIRTDADSGAGLILTGGVSLRVAESTEISIESASRIHLHDGMVYVDTGHDGRTDTVTEIVTANGVARDVGTQFEVRYRNREARLRVREGLVLFQQQDNEFRGVAGEQMLISDSGISIRHAVARDSAEWRWVQAIAPAPYADEQTVSSLISWVSRETGRRIHYAQPDLGVRARSTILHGSSQRLMPMEALSVMLETTDFEFIVTANREILIQERRLESQ
ncbi:MAG: FecR family protein [Gammaproteobacteria bacterium]